MDVVAVILFLASVLLVVCAVRRWVYEEPPRGARVKCPHCGGEVNVGKILARRRWDRTSAAKRKAVSVKLLEAKRKKRARDSDGPSPKDAA